MLGNCEKTVITPPTTTPNKWTQNQIDDQKISMASSGSRVMEKPGQELLQQQQQALRCPRCDSSNTKFCYYNNYSLSQPRHFCKACKRYWTRGGTLRNVPVGGGCRKNKRVKRPTTSSNIDTITTTTTTTTTASPSSSSTPCSNNSNPPSQPRIDVNPLLYGLNNNSCDVMNLPFSTRFVNSRVSSSGYDVQTQLNALGLGFSSGILASEVNDDGYRNGFSTTNALLSSYNSIFGGSTSTSMASTPVMASLLSSTLLQQKFISGGGGGGMKGDPFHGMSSLQELKMEGNNNSSEAAGMVVASKEVKGEGQNYIGAACQNQMEHMGMSDPSLYWNNNNAATALGGAWTDQPNIGPSVSLL